MNDADRTQANLRRRDLVERARLRGSAWRDWEYFARWQDVTVHECTSIVREATGEEQSRVALLLERLESFIPEAEVRHVDAYAKAKRCLEYAQVEYAKLKSLRDELTPRVARLSREVERLELLAEMFRTELVSLKIRAGRRSRHGVCCSFCGSAFKDRRVFVEGPGSSRHRFGVLICDECVQEATDVVVETLEQKEDADGHQDG